jgi:hypothetical protein
VHDTEPTVTTPRVELLRWPEDAARRDELAAMGVPRLLLLRDDVLPPTLADDEDWMFVPADERDLWARLQRLARRSAARDRLPALSDGVVLHHAGRTVILSEGEGALLRPLIDHFGSLVTWDDLRHALWPDDPDPDRRVTSRVSRLRGRLAPVGLEIHSVRTRGVVLDHSLDSSPAGTAGTTPEEL